MIKLYKLFFILAIFSGMTPLLWYIFT